MTHTYATMDVSPATFDEIRSKLEAAGYRQYRKPASTADSCFGCRKTPHHQLVSALFLSVTHVWNTASNLAKSIV